VGIKKEEMKKIYISGKITGIELQKAQEKFSRYESSLKVMGFDPVNPMTISPFKVDKTWEEYMKDCIRALCECEIIGMMPCWTSSRGARIEKELAEQIGLKVYYL
jgi:hypothetical protein